MFRGALTDSGIWKYLIWAKPKTLHSHVEANYYNG
jgi:hypothetical protein